MFTLGDLVRHIATIERFMLAETVAGPQAVMPAADRNLAESYDEIRTLREICIPTPKPIKVIPERTPAMKVLTLAYLCELRPNRTHLG